MAKFRRFEDIPVWIKSKEIALKVYDLTVEKTFNKEFCLKDQLRRSAISISSNIAEGFER